jgi:hypothetical protein
MTKKNPIRYWKAPEVRDIADGLANDYHPHILLMDVWFIFRSEASESNGKPVIPKPVKVSGRAAWLARHESRDQMTPLDFYVVEIPHDVWQKLTHKQRFALVDHQLCHIGVDGLVAPSVVTFPQVIERHGLWTPDLLHLGESMQQAPLFESDERVTVSVEGVH